MKHKKRLYRLWFISSVVTVLHLRAGVDETVCEQMFVESRQKLVEVTGRVRPFLAVITDLLVTVFL